MFGQLSSWRRCCIRRAGASAQDAVERGDSYPHSALLSLSGLSVAFQRTCSGNKYTSAIHAGNAPGGDVENGLNDQKKAATMRTQCAPYMDRVYGVQEAYSPTTCESLELPKTDRLVPSATTVA